VNGCSTTFYLIEEQIRTARRHLPKGYSRELPRLLNGPRRGFHASMTLRWRRSLTEMAGWTRKNLSSFVAAYQTVSVLKLGELWAIPIMLRLALIEISDALQPGLLPTGSTGISLIIGRTR